MRLVKNKNWGRISVFLMAFGLLLSIYLLFYKFSLSTGGKQSFDVCSAVFGGSCVNSLNSNISSLLGISLAGWGVLYYVVLLALFGLGKILPDSFLLPSSISTVTVALFGLILSISLITLMLIQPKLLCPICMITHISNIALFLCLKKALNVSFRQIWQGWIDGLQYLFFGKSSEPKQAIWSLIAFSSVLFLAISVFQWVKLETLSRKQTTKFEFSPMAILSGFDTTAVQSLPVKQVDPSWGPESAPVKVVMFSDFLCPFCQIIALNVKQLEEDYPGKLNITFKNFPLSNKCNQLLSDDIHPLACEAAFAAEAAHQQGLFKSYHDELFKLGPKITEQSFLEIAEKLNLNLEKFKQDYASSQVQQKIASDINEALELGIEETPVVFINGKRVNDLRIESLELLIAYCNSIATLNDPKE